TTRIPIMANIISEAELVVLFDQRNAPAFLEALGQRLLRSLHYGFHGVIRLDDGASHGNRGRQLISPPGNRGATHDVGQALSDFLQLNSIAISRDGHELVCLPAAD